MCRLEVRLGLNNATQLTWSTSSVSGLMKLVSHAGQARCGVAHCRVAHAAVVVVTSRHYLAPRRSCVWTRHAYCLSSCILSRPRVAAAATSTAVALSCNTIQTTHLSLCILTINSCCAGRVIRFNYLLSALYMIIYFPFIFLILGWVDYINTNLETLS